MLYCLVLLLLSCKSGVEADAEKQEGGSKDSDNVIVTTSKKTAKNSKIIAITYDENEKSVTSGEKEDESIDAASDIVAGATLTSEETASSDKVVAQLLISDAARCEMTIEKKDWVGKVRNSFLSTLSPSKNKKSDHNALIILNPNKHGWYNMTVLQNGEQVSRFNQPQHFTGKDLALSFTPDIDAGDYKVGIQLLPYAEDHALPSEWKTYEFVIADLVK